MKLTKRMQGVADYVTPGLIVADIGTDHSYLPIYLVQNGIAPSAIAMDVNKGPLKIAKENIEAEGLGEYITTRLSDGLKKLEPKEAQSVIVAGMGGRLVLKILYEGKDKWKDIKEFILQPQSELDFFRRQMKKWGFECVAENMIFEDGKYYPMGKYIRTSDDVSAIESMPEEVVKDANESELDAAFFQYGEGLIKQKHPVLLQYLEKEKAHFLQVREKVENSAENEKKQARMEEIHTNIKMNQFVLDYMQKM